MSKYCFFDWSAGSEYCFFDWNAGWQAKRVLPSWLMQEAIAQIPKPKFVLGEVVSFPWSYVHCVATCAT